MLNTSLGEGSFLRNRESAALGHPTALAVYSEEDFNLSWSGEPGCLAGLLSFEKISFVIGSDKVGDCKDTSGLSSRLGDRRSGACVGLQGNVRSIMLSQACRFFHVSTELRTTSST